MEVGEIVEHRFTKERWRVMEISGDVTLEKLPGSPYRAELTILPLAGAVNNYERVIKQSALDDMEAAKPMISRFAAQSIAMSADLANAAERDFSEGMKIAQETKPVNSRALDVAKLVRECTEIIVGKGTNRVSTDNAAKLAFQIVIQEYVNHE